jgi:methionine-rich copper-binding protein CopC
MPKPPSISQAVPLRIFRQWLRFLRRVEQTTGCVALVPTTMLSLLIETVPENKGPSPDCTVCRPDDSNRDKHTVSVAVVGRRDGHRLRGAANLVPGFLKKLGRPPSEPEKVLNEGFV